MTLGPFHSRCSGYRDTGKTLRDGLRDARRPVPWEWNWPPYEWQLECVPRKRGSVLIELDGLFVFVGELSFCLTIETSSGTDLLFHVHHEFGALAQEVLGILAALT